jgi:hypothetical protein
MDVDAILRRLDAEDAEHEAALAKAKAEMEAARAALERSEVFREELARLTGGRRVGNASMRDLDEKVRRPRYVESHRPMRNDERIISIVNSAGPEGITDEDVLSALIEQGWETDATDKLGLLRSYLSRATRGGLIKRIARSRYAPLTPGDILEMDDLPVDVGTAQAMWKEVSGQ